MRTIEESSSNKEDKVYLRASYEEDDCKITKPSYKKLFNINTKLVEENNKLIKHNLDIKEYLCYLEEINKPISQT